MNKQWFGRVVVDATVISIGDGPYYYRSCPVCYSKLTGEAQCFCLKCRKSYQEQEVKQRYRLCLTISDGMTLVKTTAFGNILNTLFGCSANEFHHRWKPWLNHQSGNLIVKCGLEKCLIGVSLLFGLKAVIRKTKGSTVTLKDVQDSCKTSTSYSSFCKDLIAVQIIPHCEPLCSSTLVQYLQKMKSFICERKIDYPMNDLDSGWILHSMSTDCDFNLSASCCNETENLSQTQTGITYKSFYNSCNFDQSELFPSQNLTNNSLNLSLTFLTQDSLSLSKTSQRSMDEGHNGFSQVNANKSMKTLSSLIKPSTWCMRRWQKTESKKFDTKSFNNENKILATFDESKSCFFDVDDALFKFPLSVSSNKNKNDPNYNNKNFKILNKSVLKEKSFNSESDVIKNQENLRSKKKKYLSLKNKSIKPTELSESFIDTETQSTVFPNECFCNSQSSEDSVSNPINDDRLSVLNLPESEDINYFLKAADLEIENENESIDFEQSNITASISILEIPCARNNVSNDVLSFPIQVMPESEDIDLFLAAVDVDSQFEKLSADDKLVSFHNKSGIDEFNSSGFQLFCNRSVIKVQDDVGSFLNTSNFNDLDLILAVADVEELQMKKQSDEMLLDNQNNLKLSLDFDNSFKNKKHLQVKNNVNQLSHHLKIDTNITNRSTSTIYTSTPCKTSIGFCRRSLKTERISAKLLFNMRSGEAFDVNDKENEEVDSERHQNQSGIYAMENDHKPTNMDYSTIEDRNVKYQYKTNNVIEKPIKLLTARHIDVVVEDKLSCHNGCDLFDNSMDLFDFEIDSPVVTRPSITYKKMLDFDKADRIDKCIQDKMVEEEWTVNDSRDIFDDENMYQYWNINNMLSKASDADSTDSEVLQLEKLCTNKKYTGCNETVETVSTDLEVLQFGKLCKNKKYTGCNETVETVSTDSEVFQLGKLCKIEDERVSNKTDMNIQDSCSLFSSPSSSSRPPCIVLSKSQIMGRIHQNHEYFDVGYIHKTSVESSFIDLFTPKTNYPSELKTFTKIKPSMLWPFTLDQSGSPDLFSSQESN